MRTRFLRIVTRLIDRVADSAAVIAMTSLAVIAIIVTMDATARYVFHSPIIGVHAIVEDLLQPAVIFLALPLAARIDAHLRVEIITLRRYPKLRQIREVLFMLCISLFWAVCAWQAGLRAWEAYINKQWPVGEIAVPIVISYSVVAIGCLCGAIAHLFPVRPISSPVDDNNEPAQQTSTGH